MRIYPITNEQRFAILERFSIEPEPYEWSEQDITLQIRNFLGCGEFVKSIKNNSEFAKALRGNHEPSDIQDNVRF